uniref:Uncharacterized protein n=1 Tax=Candidatus Kentrum sp. MB TaxID=2138164 RepID=A0A451BDS2_9GAMM|nr:MAG: hypothetical protein BECKMB1821G_GA0114241_105212 [Candidatus Kentron sp. MB]VFK33841.1 MAG: hypothetical protein BECKMB1821I_GA0114274_105412 [Candidatus Kentron sp. MB]VFK76431.1 MAG: hypothetical protein BECKMB1821H_GA0114242_105612 [Candidatus Kentron sp. MB]
MLVKIISEGALRKQEIEVSLENQTIEFLNNPKDGLLMRIGENICLSPPSPSGGLLLLFNDPY